MKFANYIFDARGANNLGDNMQIIAIDYIYKKIGLKKEEIIYVNKNDLKTYKGEYIILPITLPLVDYSNNGIADKFSSRIIPVFIGLTLAKETLSEKEIIFYKRHEPIGCRDEKTLKLMRQHNITSYLHGCITVTMPKRVDTEERNTSKKVFIVDVAPKLKEIIPQDLLTNSVEISHSVESSINPKEEMKELYERYIREASLVITSRLHCAIPCMAAGIPVILGQDQLSYRFGWLEKLLPIYDKNSYKNIDWTPNAINYEEHKQKVIEFTKDRIKKTYEENKAMLDISFFYEEREKMKYKNDCLEPLKIMIDEKFRNIDNPNFSYSIWGLTQISELIHEYINKNYPNAKLSNVYDKYRKLIFQGLETKAPEELLEDMDDLILFTSFSGQEKAKEFFDNHNIPKSRYMIWMPML